jgi:hypothetical protein
MSFSFRLETYNKKECVWAGGMMNEEIVKVEFWWRFDEDMQQFLDLKMWIYIKHWLEIFNINLNFLKNSEFWS